MNRLAQTPEGQVRTTALLDGYNRKTKTDVSMAGGVDLERDTTVLVQLCKPAPKESLWSRINAKL